MWVLRSGRPWRQLPERFGAHTTCYNRFVRWRKAGIWDRLVAALAQARPAAQPDLPTDRAEGPGAHARGEETRDRILHTALKLFAVGGVDGVSTRQIAAAASVPPASLRYYFKDKRRLHDACIHHIDRLALELIGPALTAAEAVLADTQATAERLVEAYCYIQEQCTELMIGSDDGTIALLVIRSDLPTEHGLVQSDSSFGIRIFTCYLDIIMRLSNQALDFEGALYLATMLHGQLLSICMSRPRLEAGQWAITPERMELLQRMLRNLTATALRGHVVVTGAETRPLSD